MKVVILCGGLGTRLREETEYRPKPMVPVGGRPILWHIMKLYAQHGHKDFILCLGYKGEVIKEFFRNYHWNLSDVTLSLGKHPQIQYHNQHDEEDWNVTMIDTGQKTMTGGRLKRVLPYIQDDTFLMTYGDGLSDIDIRAEIAFHKSHGLKATVACVRPPARFGRIVLEGEKVTAFEEKPQTEGGFINGGFFVLDPSVIDGIEGDHTVWEREPLEGLAASGQLAAWTHEGFWQPMDTLRDKQSLTKMWESNKAPWKLWDAAPSAVSK